jgi:hypothetical protein
MVDAIEVWNEFLLRRSDQSSQELNDAGGHPPCSPQATPLEDPRLPQKGAKLIASVGGHV